MNEVFLFNHWILQMKYIVISAMFDMNVIILCFTVSIRVLWPNLHPSKSQHRKPKSKKIGIRILTFNLWRIYASLVNNVNEEEGLWGWRPCICKSKLFHTGITLSKIMSSRTSNVSGILDMKQFGIMRSNPFHADTRTISAGSLISSIVSRISSTLLLPPFPSGSRISGLACKNLQQDWRKRNKVPCFLLRYLRSRDCEKRRNLAIQWRHKS